ncbi:MAG: D-tyrosyl-tRNA(Tyr) deacylase [Deltaproteobacteria bacterium]|nr:D-tyrosyl-tRNA(Tyr) deacylase [Deltaproteobacteria bacterium]
MRAVIQRVSEAQVVVDAEVTGKIGAGLCVLLGVHKQDTPERAHWLAEKIGNLRIFADDQGKMNRSVNDIGGEILVVSQFTVYGDGRKGNRPSFTDAAEPARAIPLYEQFIARLRAAGLAVATGRFGADMKLSLVNDGPVTLVLDS